MMAAKARTTTTGQKERADGDEGQGKKRRGRTGRRALRRAQETLTRSQRQCFYTPRVLDPLPVRKSYHLQPVGYPQPCLITYIHIYCKRAGRAICLRAHRADMLPRLTSTHNPPKRPVSNLLLPHVQRSNVQHPSSAPDSVSSRNRCWWRRRRRR